MDTAFLKANKTLAGRWEDKTGRSRRDLETVLFLGSGIALIGNMTSTMNPVMAVGVAGCILRGLYPQIRPQSTEEEQMAAESFGLSGTMIKYMYTTGYVMGVSIIAKSIAYGIAAVVTGNDEYWQTCFNDGTLGLGFFGFMSASYMSKSGK